MNKKMKQWAAGLLLVCFCLAAAACGRKPAQQDTPTQITTQPQDTTQGTVPTDTQETQQGTAPTQNDPTRPTIYSDTEVESGRVEGTGTAGQQDQTTPPATKPADTGTNTGLSMNYKQYMAMSSADQQLFFDEHFRGDALAFHNWFQKIKQEYEDETPEIIATGPIDLEDYINP